jgi:hypothetical protein
MDGITKEFLAREIENIEALEGSAYDRFMKARRRFRRARLLLLKSDGELKSLRLCRKEWERRLAAMAEGASHVCS